MKVSYHLLPSGTIRLTVVINKQRIRISTKLRTSPHRWIDERSTGKGSVFINYELDRISQQVNEFMVNHPVYTYTKQEITNQLTCIVLNNAKTLTQRKTISDYFQDFINEKKTEVSPVTHRPVKPGVIHAYHRAFELLLDFERIELEQVSKQHYHQFLSHLLESYKLNYSGKVIKQLKAFFKWCEIKGFPINLEHRTWKVISEETDDETRALNRDQLLQLYELEVDPLEVYSIAKTVHKKHLDGQHIEQLTASIETARRQAIAMASIGPHKEDFWALDDSNVFGNVLKYRRGKNQILCTAPFVDNDIWHAREFANLKGGALFPRLIHINYYLTYLREICEFPFHITASTFRKTFGSIIYFESDHPNKMGVIMKAYGHKKESTTRKYLGIQDDDLTQDHMEIFSRF